MSKRRASGPPAHSPLTPAQRLTAHAEAIRLNQQHNAGTPWATLLPELRKNHVLYRLRAQDVLALMDVSAEEHTFWGTNDLWRILAVRDYCCALAPHAPLRLFNHLDLLYARPNPPPTFWARAYFMCAMWVRMALLYVGRHLHPGQYNYQCHPAQRLPEWPSPPGQLDYGVVNTHPSRDQRLGWDSEARDWQPLWRGHEVAVGGAHARDPAPPPPHFLAWADETLFGRGLARRLAADIDRLNGYPPPPENPTFHRIGLYSLGARGVLYLTNEAWHGGRLVSQPMDWNDGLEHAWRMNGEGPVVFQGPVRQDANAGDGSAELNLYIGVDGIDLDAFFNLFPLDDHFRAIDMLPGWPHYGQARYELEEEWETAPEERWTRVCMALISCDPPLPDPSLPPGQ